MKKSVTKNSHSNCSRLSTEHSPLDIMVTFSTEQLTLAILPDSDNEQAKFLGGRVSGGGI